MTDIPANLRPAALLAVFFGALVILCALAWLEFLNFAPGRYYAAPISQDHPQPAPAEVSLTIVKE